MWGDRRPAVGLWPARGPAADQGVRRTLSGIGIGLASHLLRGTRRVLGGRLGGGVGAEQEEGGEGAGT
jgi:hypothetical protein